MVKEMGREYRGVWSYIESLERGEGLSKIYNYLLNFNGVYRQMLVVVPSLSPGINCKLLSP
jgi:hypothetical protein